MTIIESEPKLCPNCWWSWIYPDWISTSGSVCQLCWGTGKITITRTIINDYPNNPIKPPYEITC